MPAVKTGSRKIADILLRSKVISDDVIAAAEEEAQSRGVRLEKYLVEKKLVSPADMTLVLSEYLKMPPISLTRFTPDQKLLEIVPTDMMKHRLIVPVGKMGKTLTVALGDPFDLIAIDELGMRTGYEVMALVTSEFDVADVLARCAPANSEAESFSMEDILKETDYEVGHEAGGDEHKDENLESMLQGAEGAPVVRMVNMILLEALRSVASDIHLEPQEKRLGLRYRIDGELKESPNPPKSLQGAITSRFKLMSGMNIAERRIPQDGRIKIRAMGKEVDLRVNTLPTIYGEKIVLRVLDKSALFGNLAALGLDEEAGKAMKRAVNAPNGIVLVTGPTGSGKTTTLYSCLQELNTPDTNIVTCEDPVEYQLEGINQVQINAFVGLTFSAALRSILRQDPDVVLVGEIRDSETAEIAIKAALTGHLVLSTLHTNNAPGAITRLIDMGIDPSLLAYALVLSQAQRLIRRLCKACKKKLDKLPLDVLETYHIDPEQFKNVTIYGPGGCPKCNNSGYKGRIAIMEVLPMMKWLRQDILAGTSIKVISEKAKAAGCLTLKDVGLRKVVEGLTSFQAALEVTGGD